MAAVRSQPRPQQPSDPFVDPNPPPSPPPKSRQNSKMPVTTTTSRDSNSHEITESLRDPAAARITDGPRNRIGRSQTTAQPSSVPHPFARRSQPQESAQGPEKQKTSGKPRKKGSQHADVIDRMDFTGVGPMFHHDGPFDACAPSRNRQRNKAPLYAWTVRPEDLSTQPHEGAYPAPNTYAGFSNEYIDPPKKKVDAIAEAWGIHEPEPFEEFFAGGGSSRPEGDTPASSIFNESHNTRAVAPARRPHEPTEETRNRIVRRSGVPPPQPIFVSGSEMNPAEPIGGSPTNAPPKRSKSLMQRIRKMRDSPNVPVAPECDEQLSSPSSPMDSSPRPTHRPQNSFLGRFGGNSRQNPGSPTERTEPYIFIDPQANNKELPAMPQISNSNSTNTVSGESPSSIQYDNGQSTPAPGTSPGLGRKTSLMKKVGRVVRGAR